jgi:hypothetical protein
MKKFLLLGFLIIGINSFSQVYFRNMVYNRKSAYLEVMGNGKYYSLNYEWLFHDYGIKQGVRGGFGVFPNFFNPNKPLCITLNAEYVSFWLHRYHHIEWGAGPSYDNESYKKTSITTDYVIASGDTIPIIKTHTEQGKTSWPMAFGRLGYRYQDPDGGWMFRVGWTPYCTILKTTKLLYDGIVISKTVVPFQFSFLSFGASIGYNFY